MIAPVKPNRIRRILSRTAFTLLAIYAMIIIALALLETRLVYPGAYVTTTPLQKALSTGPIQYTTSDGNKLNGRLIKRKGCSNYVLFMHGNFSKAQRLDEWAVRLSSAFDATVLIAEYRGYEDDITPTEIGLVHDCEAARDYLCENFGIQKTDIILYGRSLGGGCAVALAANGGAKTLVLERTFDELVGIARRQYPWIPVRLIMQNRFDSVEKIKDYFGPIVIIHGTRDELIPLQCSRRLFEAAESDQKKLIEVPGMGHNGALPPQCLQEIVDTVDWFKSHPR
ncbi:MAG: alpha/beta hydrolase [Rhodopirellula sp.]|nr:alpha/beta hydrolase [Rhodopirellula sp.]